MIGIENGQMQAITLRATKLIIVLLLGVLLAWQGAFRVIAGPSPVPGTNKNCCCNDCDFNHCPTCGAKPKTPSSPPAPASLPVNPQNELQALAVVTGSAPTPSSPLLKHSLSCVPLSASVTDIPLFQRDCSYLL